MENKSPRYKFGAFVFGTDEHLQLSIQNLKPSGIGYTMEVAFELTKAERQELIELLITTKPEEDK